MKPKAVLAYCREKGIKAVDIRFPDGLGRWCHFSIPASSLTESLFETGLGLEAGLFARSNETTPWIVTPVSDAKYLDPLQQEPTLVLMASIQDAWTGEESWHDQRALVNRLVEAFRGTGLVDDLLVSTTVPFRLQSPGCLPTEGSSNKDLERCQRSDVMPLSGGSMDPDAHFRWALMHSAVDAGLVVERQYVGKQSSSEFLLGTKPIAQACDDHLIMRSLVESSAMQQRLESDQCGLRTKSAWTLIKGNQSILNGSRGFGLSDIGWYAAGGILKHSLAIQAIAASSPLVQSNEGSKQFAFLSDCSPASLVHVEPMSSDPRYRVLSYPGNPAVGCPYLTLSAIAMAMLDGILQKIAPETEPIASAVTTGESGSTKAELATRLVEDSSFLMHGEVFSERLIEFLLKQLDGNTL